MFKIDIMSRVPVYEQIIEQMEKFILTGILSAKEQVPSVRSLSVELSVNPNTIQKAYSDLDRREIIYSVPGRGCALLCGRCGYGLAYREYSQGGPGPGAARRLDWLYLESGAVPGLQAIPEGYSRIQPENVTQPASGRRRARF